MDTLAVLLTPAAQGGISVVLLAGARSIDILAGLFRRPSGARLDLGRAAPGRLLYGFLVDGGETIDEVVLCRAPAGPGPSPAFEINCHGGALPARRVLGALAARGAVEVAWPEFVREAGRAGAFDRVQAEAAAALPGALTGAAARMLIAQYGGALSRDVRGALEQCGDAAAVRGVLERLLATARYGTRLVRPARVAVAGRPNVGKSSLMNALLRHDRVIVHSEPGTTRDVIEERCDICGLPVNLVDMAGLRDSCDAVEVEGVLRARQAMAGVDLALIVLDSSVPLEAEDAGLLSGTRNRPRLIVLNKCDLPERGDAREAARAAGAEPIAVSALFGHGLADLEAAVVQIVAGACPDLDGPVVFTDRQEALLRRALDMLSASPPDSAGARSALGQVV